MLLFTRLPNCLTTCSQPSPCGFVACGFMNTSLPLAPGRSPGRGAQVTSWGGQLAAFAEESMGAAAWPLVKHRQVGPWGKRPYGLELSQMVWQGTRVSCGMCRTEYGQERLCRRWSGLLCLCGCNQYFRSGARCHEWCLNRLRREAARYRLRE